MEYEDENDALNGFNGFGVTPAIMSTGGALLTLSRLFQQNPINNFEWLSTWANTWWSEYSLYRIALDHSKTFDKLYDRERAHFSVTGTSLSCGNVWFGNEVWTPSEVFEDETCNENVHCLFSVIQSTSGASPKLIADNIAGYLG